MITATIFDIQRNSFVDGPGIRTTVFFKGCNLRCAWCHNPESQSPVRQMMFYKNKCKGCGKCKEKCPYSLENCNFCGKCVLYCPHDAREICGREYTTREVMEVIKRDMPYYAASDGGVTFSGGECMLQIDFLEEILGECKTQGIHTAIDTAGHIPYSSFERILPYTDLFLYDIKCMDSETHKRYTGVSNELILANLARLLKSRAPIWVRIPIINGVNDTIEEMLKIRSFFEENGFPERIELLPYHAMGEHKYGALGRECHSFSVPDEEKMQLFREVFDFSH